jgi:tetratricopeptide (TPR) repeat protein
VALALIVIGFGIESTLDWTWYFPGVSVPVLLCAGWLVGRGPLAAPLGWLRSRRSLLERPGAVAIAASVGVIALAGAWMQWLPQRSADQVIASVNASTNAQAFDDARAAISSDPLALEPRFALAGLYQSINNVPAARAALTDAVNTQPRNPATWAQLGRLEFQAGEPQRAVAALHHVIELDHTPDTATRNAWAQIGQAQATIAPARTAAAASSGSTVSPRRRSRGRGRGRGRRPAAK